MLTPTAHLDLLETRPAGPAWPSTRGSIAAGARPVDPHVDRALLDRLGLTHGQTRECACAAQDTIWLTADGHEFGAGDLGGTDLARAARVLRDGERLLVVESAARHDADWWTHLRWIVEPDAVFSVTPWTGGHRPARLADDAGCGALDYQVISVAEAATRLTR